MINEKVVKHVNNLDLLRDKWRDTNNMTMLIQPAKITTDM